MKGKRRYFYRYLRPSGQVEHTLTYNVKPVGNTWVEYFPADICCPQPVCGLPVQFNCVGDGFFVEFADSEDNIVIDIYSLNGDASYSSQIPQGIFTLYISGIVANAPFYINGEIVGTADGSGSLTLIGYDTTTIKTMAQCDNNGNVQVTLNFNSISSSYNDAELSGLVQQKIFTADGLTLLAQSVLGGGDGQTFMIPYVPIMYCVDVPIVFVKDDLGLFPVFQVGGSFPGGLVAIFYNPNVATQVCDAGGTMPHPTYTVSLGDGGGQ